MTIDPYSHLRLTGMVRCPIRADSPIATGMCVIGRKQHFEECEERDYPALAEAQKPEPPKVPTKDLFPKQRPGRSVGAGTGLPKKPAKEKNPPPMYPYTARCKRLHHSATLTGRACNTCRVKVMMERIHAKQQEALGK